MTYVYMRFIVGYGHNYLLAQVCAYKYYIKFNGFSQKKERVAMKYVYSVFIMLAEK